MQQNFTVSSGLGAALQISGGSLWAGQWFLKLGMSGQCFWFKSKSERILFIIDSSRGMLTDEKGGLNGYKVIRQVTELISNLAPGTLFNVILRVIKTNPYCSNQNYLRDGKPNETKSVVCVSQCGCQQSGDWSSGSRKRPPSDSDSGY